MIRRIKFTSIYEDGDEVVDIQSIEIPEDLDGEELTDFLFAFTGTGRTEGDAGYFAESVDKLEPIIFEEWC